LKRASKKELADDFTGSAGVVFRHEGVLAIEQRIFNFR
jgi:hypothetical protein